MKKILLSSFIALSLFGFNSIQGNVNNGLQGKVIKAYVAQGYGRMEQNWLFMDVKDKNGKIIKVAIAPTFKISNLGINEGDEVNVQGFTPPMFANGVIKAIDIYDVTQKRDYPISGYGCNHFGYHH